MCGERNENVKGKEGDHILRKRDDTVIICRPNGMERRTCEGCDVVCQVSGHGTAVASGAREGAGCRVPGARCQVPGAGCRIGRGHERGLEGVGMGCGPKVGPGAKARDSLLKHDVSRGGDAACGGVVDPITKRAGRIAHEHTTERFKIQFVTLVVRGFGKGNASEHTECCCVWCGTCEKGEGNAPNRTNGSAECAIAEEHGGTHST
jgi:hypothetical protein